MIDATEFRTATGVTPGADHRRMLEIIDEVSQCANIGVRDILCRSRRRDVAWPRQYAMFLCRREGFSYPQIARFFRRDHSTVIHGVKAVSERLMK